MQCCSAATEHRSSSAGSLRLHALDDERSRQQAPAAEAELLDLPFESDMKSFSGGSTAAAPPAGSWLGPSESSAFMPAALDWHT
jgi:hypothetical protein